MRRFYRNRHATFMKALLEKKKVAKKILRVAETDAMPVKKAPKKAAAALKPEKAAAALKPVKRKREEAVAAPVSVLTEEVPAPKKGVKTASTAAANKRQKGASGKAVEAAPSEPAASSQKKKRAAADLADDDREGEGLAGAVVGEVREAGGAQPGARREHRVLQLPARPGLEHLRGVLCRTRAPP